MLQLNNISKSFNEVQALKDITFEVKKNELFGLIGPDGAGKTTLFRIITTLLLPNNGNAFVNGFDTVKDYKEIRKITGYMPGRFSLYQDLTVEENLKFYATVFGTNIKKNYHLIEDIYSHIEPFKKRLAGKLSGGMKQKLALSCALIHKPEILVLDEPTTGVDAVSRAEFWQMLKNLQHKGITIIVSTPYMDEAMLCDRVGLIQNGNIFTIDQPDNIVNSFEKQLWAVKADNNKFKLITDLRNHPNVESAFAFGENIHVSLHDNKQEIKTLEEYLSEQGNQKVVIKQTKAGIEDVFLHFSQQNSVTQ